MKSLVIDLEKAFKQIKDQEGRSLDKHLKLMKIKEKIPNDIVFIKQIKAQINQKISFIQKLPKAGFALRWTRAHMRLISHIKHIEELEKRQRELEAELASLKKKWFRG